MIARADNIPRGITGELQLTCFDLIIAAYCLEESSHNTTGSTLELWIPASAVATKPQHCIRNRHGSFIHVDRLILGGDIEPEALFPAQPDHLSCDTG